MTQRSGSRPRYRELPPVNDGSGARLAWDYFGRQDQLGTLNFIDPDAVCRARDEIRSGRRVGLTLPLDLPNPPLAVGRRTYEHTIEVRQGGRDDALSSFFPQGSSQWDGLRHVRYKQFGYYGGRQEEDLAGTDLGIDAMAAEGIVTRGVLIDIPAFRASLGRPYRADQREPVTVEEIDAACAWERVQLLPGDILLLRTGWLAWYLALDETGRSRLKASLHNGENGLDCPGLESGVATAGWLWDHGIAAVAADNPALEVLRVQREAGFLHRFLIPLLGMPIGEYWYLEDLHQACQQETRFTCCLFSQPLRLPRAAGTPSNALAVL